MVDVLGAEFSIKYENGGNVFFEKRQSENRTKVAIGNVKLKCVSFKLAQ